MTTRLILVGGFLGVGKTTLLWQAARRLMARGKRVGLITNDQAPNLVDTSLLLQNGLDVQEVSGSCFCCNFPGLLMAADSLVKQVEADVLIAEPVGSCTDLSATILQPLKLGYSDNFSLAPLSVLADPACLTSILSGGTAGLHPSAAYIVRKQLEEADIVVANKADLLTPAEKAEIARLVASALPDRPLMFVSALSGDGVDEWLASVLSATHSGARIAAVDYDTYAEGEAVLGWLNAGIVLSTSATQPDWAGFCERFMAAVRADLARDSAAVGHVKILLSTDDGFLVANLTDAAVPPTTRGRIDGSPPEAHLIVNARAQMAPEALESVVRSALAAAAGADTRTLVKSIRSLRPGRPNPTFRHAEVVPQRETF